MVLITVSNLLIGPETLAFLIVVVVDLLARPTAVAFDSKVVV
jgi:hypothetical protein